MKRAGRVAVRLDQRDADFVRRPPALRRQNAQVAVRLAGRERDRSNRQTARHVRAGDSCLNDERRPRPRQQVLRQGVRGVHGADSCDHDRRSVQPRRFERRRREDQHLSHSTSVLNVVVGAGDDVRLRRALDDDRQAEADDGRRRGEADVDAAADQRDRRVADAACSRRSRTPARRVSARSPAVRGMMRHDRNMMPSATRPMTSSGCREFLRVIRLSGASTAASAPRPATHSAGDVGHAASATRRRR